MRLSDFILMYGQLIETSDHDELPCSNTVLPSDSGKVRVYFFVALDLQHFFLQSVEPTQLELKAPH